MTLAKEKTLALKASSPTADAEAFAIWVARRRVPLLGETRPSQSGSPTARLVVLTLRARARGTND
jgi:hypothetical protein